MHDQRTARATTAVKKPFLSEGNIRAGEFEVLANDTTRLLLKWPKAIPPSAVGHKLEFALASRGDNPAAVRRTVKATWPIT